MVEVALVGYVFAALAYVALATLTALNQRGEQIGRAVLAAAGTSALWAAALAWQVYSVRGFGVSPRIWFVVELARDAGLLIFLAMFLYRSAPNADLAQRWMRALKGISALVAIPIVAVTLGELVALSGQNFDLRTYAIAVFLVLSIIGLLFIEQIFRGTPAEQRWAIKFLCLGVGGAFAFDFYMYAEALLFHVIDADVWSARGYINALVVPMLAISAARNPQWAVTIVVSRQLIFRSVTLMGAGLYLLAMALTGYYIRVMGGAFGTVGQTVFLFSALVLLLALMFSGELRARIKVFFNKHFFRSKYDYREEWLRINEILSDAPLDASLCERALVALAHVVESTGGALYQLQAHHYAVAARWNMPVPVGDTLAQDAPMLCFMAEKHWVINLEEYARTPQRYGALVLPKSLTDNARAWAVVPLFHHAILFGFAVLAQPRAPLALNWEIRDMLLMTGRHIAAHLALRESNAALIEARQFEAFNRLSAYVVHDLKNLVAQLSLLVSNAARHRDNPAFMDDAIRTVTNAAEKMNKLLGQLRQGRMEAGDAKRVNVHALVHEAVRHRSLQAPVPTALLDGADAVVLANPERLMSVLEHLIQNAQDATPAEGAVRVQVSTDTVSVEIAIIDTGCGMDANFLREQLFKPFHTTKGNAGMGIGVYESREFVQAIGGRLDVVSTAGQGATFTLRLPIYGVNERATAAHSVGARQQ